MIKTLKHIITMNSTLSVNSFIYYFKRLWLIGKILPESLYADTDLKKIFTVIIAIINQIMGLVAKPIYLLCFVGLPLAMFNPTLNEQSFPFAVQILFFLNCILGSLQDSQIFTVNREKITCIKYMQMNPRNYVKAYLAFKNIPFFIYYLPCILVASTILGGTILEGIALWLALLSFRMMGEALQLYIFDKTGKVLCRSVAIVWSIILVSLVGAYCTLATGFVLPIAAILLNPISVVIFVLLGGFCFYYITVGYQNYEKKFHHSIDINFLFSTAMKQGQQSAFTDVEIKDKDLEMKNTKKEQFNLLKGYAYFNALFFDRHKRQLLKPVFIRLSMIAIVFVASIILILFNKTLAIELSQKLTSTLPLFVFIMYCLTVAQKAIRAMFYNCDKNMLHYAYYRQPQTVLKCFKIRLLRISLYNIAVGGALCVAAIGFCLLCGTAVLTVDMLMFCIAILLLSVLFSVHHLCLYYIFQPFSENLSMKNPFFSIINSVMYVLCFICLQIDTGGFVFTMTVLGFTIAYVVAALILVYKFAPKTFRAK